MGPGSLLGRVVAPSSGPWARAFPMRPCPLDGAVRVVHPGAGLPSQSPAFRIRLAPWHARVEGSWGRPRRPCLGSPFPGGAMCACALPSGRALRTAARTIASVVADVFPRDCRGCVGPAALRAAGRARPAGRRMKPGAAAGEGACGTGEPTRPPRKPGSRCRAPPRCGRWRRRTAPPRSARAGARPGH